MNAGNAQVIIGGVRGNLSLVLDGFRCAGTIQETYLAKELVVNAESLSVYKEFMLSRIHS